MVFKSLHNLSPVYSNKMFRKFNAYYDLRNSASYKLAWSKPRTYSAAFPKSGPARWNSPSQDLRERNKPSGIFYRETCNLLFFFRLPHGNRLNQFGLSSLYLFRIYF